MKRTILTVACMVVAIIAAAQVSYQVKGTAHKDATTLMVSDMADRRATPETVQVQNGQFTLTGSKPEGTVMVILDRDHRMQSFFIVDGEAITLDMNTDEANGSEQNVRLSRLVRQLNDIQDEEKMENVMKQAIHDNPDNAVAAFALNMLMYSLDYEELKSITESGAPFLSLPLCEQPKAQVKALALRAPGTMFRDLAEADTLGVTHQLSEYVGKGQYVLVDFWASWCGPCMMEMPNVKANYDKYHPKGFQVVGLSFDRNADAWKRAIREGGLNWIHLSDLKFWQTVAAETYGIRSIPSSILCDPTGKIIAIDLRGEKLGQKLKDIYGL